MDLQDSMLSLLSHKIKDELVERVGVPYQETVICFGSICTDVSECLIGNLALNFVLIYNYPMYLIECSQG